MENHNLAVMDPIDISSSESDVDDWDLEGDMEPETSSRSKSGSLTHSNDHSSHVVATRPYFKGYDGVQVPRFLFNSNKRPQIQLKPSSSRGFRSFATSSSQPDTKWGLPPHLQACLEECTPSSRSADTLENVRSRVKRKTHSDAFYPRAVKLESGTDYNTLDEESDEEVIMYEKVGSRRIPPESGYKKVKSEVSPAPFRPVSTAQYANSGSVKVEGTTLRPSFGSVSTAQYATSGSAKVESTGLPPSFGSTAQPGNLGDPAQRNGVAAEKQGERNERLVYQAALQDLNQPRVEATLPDGLLSVSLLKHQRIALAWLLPKERASLNCCGGFLADDQGLGKTISMIALIQMQRHLESKTKVEDEQKKTTESLNLDDDDDFDDVKVTTCPKRLKGSQDIRTTRPAAGTLVVCPASVLRQWACELKNKVAEEFKLSVLIYHGSNRTKDPIELASYDVVLTTYALVGNEVPKLPLADEADGDKEWYELSSAFKQKKKKGKKEKSESEIESESGTLAKVGWLRVILDEAQIIKNHRTKVARACCGLRAKRRWCLSGTPIQNTIEDLFSYFRFLRYDPYAEYRAFCSAIKSQISRNPSHGYKKLQAVLRAIMLRRTKGTIIDGEPVLNLPPKTINMASFDFSTTERTFYDDLEQKSRSQFKKYADAGTVNQNYANILLMLLRLRQACGHPRLTVMGSNSKSKGSIETAMKFPQDVLLAFLNRLDTSAPICHLCSDPPEDAVISSSCRHIFCYPCISEYLTGDDNTCPAPECHKRLGVDFLFSKSTLMRCIRSDDHSSMPSDDGGFHDYISTKIKAAIEHLESTCKPQKNTPTCSDSVETEGAPIKAIVFSQWTKMLDIFEISLKNSGLEYRRLDGTMTLGLRDANVSDFNTDPKVSVILMSLKAGNLGLNMIAASHVVLLDLWWNPTTEDQAIDRAHRIGQTRPVTVTRITIKNTVEDRILALQEKKRIMVASAFGEEYGGGQATRLTVDDLKYLFMY